MIFNSIILGYLDYDNKLQPPLLTWSLLAHQELISSQHGELHQKSLASIQHFSKTPVYNNSKEKLTNAVKVRIGTRELQHVLRTQNKDSQGCILNFIRLNNIFHVILFHHVRVQLCRCYSWFHKLVKLEDFHNFII